MDAIIKLLDASVDKLDSAEAWMCISLHLGAGHDIEAFLLKRSASTMPCFFWGLADSAAHAEWLRQQGVNSLTSKLQSGKLKLPGVELPVQDVPADLKYTPVALPHLHAIKYQEIRSQLVFVTWNYVGY